MRWLHFKRSNFDPTVSELYISIHTYMDLCMCIYCIYKYTHTHICGYNMKAHDVHLLLMLFQTALCLSAISLILLVSSDEYSCRRCEESSLKATTGAWPRPRSWRRAWGGG